MMSMMTPYSDNMMNLTDVVPLLLSFAIKGSIQHSTAYYSLAHYPLSHYSTAHYLLAHYSTGDYSLVVEYLLSGMTMMIRLKMTTMVIDAMVQQQWFV